MFEIKIFANPAGFKELPLSNPNPIFSQDIVDKINFDLEDRGLLNSDYSVVYASEVYVYTHSFLASPEANFRESLVHMAVAVKR